MFKPIFFTLFIFLATSSLSLGERLFVELKGKLLPIVGAEAHHPIYEQKGKRKTLKNAAIISKTEKQSKSSGLSIALNSAKVVTFKQPTSKISIELSITVEEWIENAYIGIRSHANPVEDGESDGFGAPDLVSES